VKQTNIYTVCCVLVYAINII